MTRPYRILLLICLGALALRLFALPFVQHPGLGDPNHYYNLALRLLDGYGFTIDYIWQYYNPPESLVHPEDFWMPLTALLSAVSMRLLGVSLPAALLPFILIGSLLPILAYAAARQYRCSPAAALFAAASTAVLPEFLLNSLRADTTLPNNLFIGLCILALTYGLQTRRLWPFALSGAAAGLAYLTRGDNLLLLPMLAAVAVIYALWGTQKSASRHLPPPLQTAGLSPLPQRLGGGVKLALVPLVALVVVSPWLVRNLQLTGSALTPNLGRLFFLTDFREHYAYNQDFTLQTLLASQTPAQLLGKRLFEMAASLKTLYIALDVFLPVAVAGGALLLIARRNRERWLTLAPTLALLAGMYFFYTLLAPIANQGGSFKKAYLTLIPLLLPLAADALETALTDRRLRLATMALAVLFTGANAVELVRAEARFVGNYLTQMQTVAEAARALPDTNGDGDIVLMAQDQFMLRYLGLRSVVIPMGSRETVLEVARRYSVDYLMMPPARPALDPLYERRETDPRFVEVVDLSRIRVRLYGFNFEAE